MKKLMTPLALALLLAAGSARADVSIPEAPPRGAGPDVGLPVESEAPPWAVPIAVAAGVALVAGVGLVVLRRRGDPT